ncbi:MAG: hypothetical protein LBB04_03480 [Oscillospiraceae bacterium]|nr:hypothetical protein [Oscillospiraceae bacterium]
MERKQARNRCRKAMARVFAGFFCALSWTAAVHATEVITLGEGDQLSEAIAAQETMYAAYELTADLSETAGIWVHDGKWVEVHLNGHKIQRQIQQVGEEVASLFTVVEGGRQRLKGRADWKAVGLVTRNAIRRARQQRETWSALSKALLC